MKMILISTFLLTITSFKLVGQTKKDSLYVFVGEKIEVKEWPQPRAVEHIDTTIVDKDTTILRSVSLSMDNRFIARYKILQQVFGSFKSDTIEFLAFDHYGIPAFSKYKYVLLFVSNYNGKLYHEKYQFVDVYKTKNGRWASGYRSEDYGHEYNKKTTIKPESIKFLEEVSYKIKKRKKEDIAEWFPSPYYKIKGNKAIVVWGNYIEELFGLKRDGILKARSIF